MFTKLYLEMCGKALAFLKVKPMLAKHGESESSVLIQGVSLGGELGKMLGWESADIIKKSYASPPSIIHHKNPSA